MESENNKLNSLFNAAKKYLRSENSIASQLKEGNTKVCPAMESSHLPNESLVAEVRVLEELLLASGFQGASNGKQQKPSLFTQMRRGKRKAYVRNIPENYYVLCLSKPIFFAKDAVFDIITEFRLFSVGVRKNPLRVRD